MRSLSTGCLVISLLLGAAGKVAAETHAELFSTALVWERANHVTSPDLIRFGDRWFLTCQESDRAGWPGGEVRVLTSKDGQDWESAALLQSPTASRGLYNPRFATAPDGRLMISVMGFVGYPNPTDPITGSGGTLKTMSWLSKDGRAWGEPALVGMNDFPLGRVVWHKGTAFSYAIGCICGSIKTVHIMTSRDGQAFESRSEEYLEKMLPYEGEMLFEGDTAYCLMAGGYSQALPGLLGAAQAPYTMWKWRALSQPIRHPRFLRLPDQRVLATVGLFDGKMRTSLCEFHPATGRFTELLELTSGEPAATGLAWHEGHVWVTYPVADGEKVRVHLARIKLK